MGMIFQIEAIDNFFFRTAAPFEAGEDSTLAKSFFPPLPSTYLGALKPLRVENPEMHKFEKHKLSRLRISYSGVLYKDEFCFPKPLDTTALAAAKTGEEEELFDLKLMVCDTAPPSSFPLKAYLHPAEKTDKKSSQHNDIYLPLSGIEEYLNDKTNISGGFRLSGHFDKEAKLGIEISPQSNTAKSGNIYEAEAIRPRDGLKLAVEAKGINIDKRTHIKLGGEGKIATIEKLLDEKSLEVKLKISSPSSDSRFFKLYFATPAIFEHGWLPSWIDPQTKRGRFFHRKRDIEVELKSAAVGRFVASGSFADNGPKDMLFAVPAGSVYYFQIIKGAFQDAVYLFHQHCISDYRIGNGYGFKKPEMRYTCMDYCERGFGYTLVGTVNKEQEVALNV